MADAPDPISLSALQHWCYCPRQCGLIHLEQAFDDNLHTLRGQAVHARTDQPGVICATGGATTVWVDFPNQKSAPLPDWLRQVVAD